MPPSAVFARAFVCAVSALSRWFFHLAAALLIAAVAVVGQMVVIRYVFAGSTVWQTEFVIYAATASVFFASPYLLLTRGHVRIGLWAEHSSPRMRRALDAIADFCSALFLFVLGWSGWIYFEEAWTNNWRTETAWELPLWIPLLPLPLGLFLTGLQACAEMMRPLAPPPAPMDEASAPSNAAQRQ